MDPSSADFSGINGRKDLHLTSVFQTNRLSFGGIGLGTRRNPFPSLSFNWRKQFSERGRDVDKIDDVIFDRPFLYMLENKSTGLILFIGHFTKPDLMSNKF
jgi:serine protease inhibitor